MSDKNEKKDSQTNDDIELDGLFEGEFVKKTIKKVKRNNMIRTIVISVFVLLIASIISNIIAKEVKDRDYAKKDAILSLYKEISSPNEFIGKKMRYESSFGGTTIYSTYKILKDKPVYTGEHKYDYGWITSDLQGTETPGIISGHPYGTMDMNKTPYNELGQRKMQFYYPFISYRKYKDDIKLLDEIGNDKYMEMALSFDKLYSVEEVRKMIPEHLITWYWMDDLNAEEKKELEKVNYENRAQDSPEEVKTEDHVYGFKAITSDGIKVDNPEFWFLQSLKKGMKSIDNTSTNSFETVNAIVEMKRVYQYLLGEHKEISPNALRIQGVVVTGNKEDLRAIKDLPFIKATSLGVITDKY